MHPMRRAVPVALAIGLIAAAPGAAEGARRAPRPVAHAAGDGGGPPIYPGLVNTRLVRTQKALDRAVDYADDGNTAKAVSSLYTARLQLKLAWRAAKYQIQHAPPPPPPDLRQRGRIPVQVKHHRKARKSRKARRHRAHKSGAPVGGSSTADQFTTTGGVLDMQHTVAQTAIGMIDMAHGSLRDSLGRTIFTALDQRDVVVAYVHSIDTPAPPGDGLARASGAPVGGTWSTTMSPVSDQIDDETDQIEGVLALSTTLGVGIKRTLKDAEFQALESQRAINQYWPPAPPG